MQDRVFVGLSYIIASFYGCINRQDKCLVTVNHNEDRERTILYYLTDGAVCRLDNFSVKTNYYTEPGGNQIERTKLEMLETTQYLADIYPDLGRMTWKNGRPEFQFKPIGRRREDYASRGRTNGTRITCVS